MRDLTLSDVEQLRAQPRESDVALEMDEEAFRGFYDRTARGLLGYLSRVTGDRQLADDLLQEAYYRFLRSPNDYESEAHRRNSLFRIASNLVRDNYRRRRVSPSKRLHPARRRSRTRRVRRRRNARQISVVRWRDCVRATASCCGSPTREDRRTARLQTLWD